MAKAELEGVVSGDASDFIKASEDAQDSLADLGKAGEKTGKQLANVLGGTGRQRDALGRFVKQAKGAEAVLGRFGKRGSKVGSIIDKLRKNLGKFGGVAKKAGQAGLNAFGGLVKTFSLVALGATALVTALAGIGTAAVVNFAKFEQSFSQVRTLVDSSQEVVEELARGVRDLSVAFGVDVTEATEAAYQAISAGQEPTEAVEFLRVAFEGAAAGAASVVDAVNLYTSALNTFAAENLSATDVSDIFFKTVKLGKTTITELAASFGQVGPIAAAAGVTLSDLGAALAATTAQGLSTAEAATAIKASIAGIVNPAGAARGALLGIGVSAASLRDEGLVKTFERIAEATGGSIEQITKFLPNIRAVNAAAILAGSGLDKFRDSAIATANATGASSEAFAKVEKDIALQFKRITQTFNDAFREIGKALAPIVKELGSVFGKFATETRGEVQALATVLEERFGQAADSVRDLEGAVQSSGGAITLSLGALSKILGSIGEGFIESAEPIAGFIANLRLMARVVEALAFGPVPILAQSLSLTTRLIVAVGTASLGLSEALARATGFDDIAESLSRANTALAKTGEEAKEALGAITDLALNASKAAFSADLLDKQYKEVAFGLVGAGTAANRASQGFKDLSKELGETKAKADKAADLKELNDRLKGTLDNSKGAAKGVADLGTAAEEVTPKLEKTAGASLGLSKALGGIAAGSETAARGLAALGPSADAIAKSIAGIGAAQTGEQALAGRQDAIAALIKGADDALAKAVGDAKARGKKTLDEAKAALETAKKLSRAAQEDKGRGAIGQEKLDEVLAKQAAAQLALEAATQKVSKAFGAERTAATKVFEGVLSEIEKLEGGLNGLRERSVANAVKAGDAEIARLRKEASEAKDILEKRSQAGELSPREAIIGKLAIDSTLQDSISQLRESVEVDVDAIGVKFDELEEKARDAKVGEALDAAFGDGASAISKAADALTGEFADAVAQAKEDAETFEQSQEELEKALARIVKQAAEAGASVEDFGKKSKGAGGDVKKFAADGFVAGSQFKEALASLNLTAEQTESLITRVGQGAFAELGEKAAPLEFLLAGLAIDGFGPLSEAVTDLGEKLDTDGKEKIAELANELATDQISLEMFAEGLEDLAESSGLTGDALDDLVRKFNEVGESALEAASKAEQAAKSIEFASSRGFARSTGGETQAGVNQRFAGATFGTQRVTASANFTSQAAADLGRDLGLGPKALAQRARQAGGLANLAAQSSGDRGGLSFDLGGNVRVDQLARLQAGERVLTRAQNSALASLFSGFSKQGRGSQQTFNISPTFNIEGGNAENNRAMARSLIPEITRATRLGVVGKSLL